MAKSGSIPKVGTRMTMLGTKGTEVYYGDGPITHAPPFGRMDGQPEPAVPLAWAAATGRPATFTALHEPYTGAPKLGRLGGLEKKETGVGLAAGMPNTPTTCAWPSTISRIR